MGEARSAGIESKRLADIFGIEMEDGLPALFWFAQRGEYLVVKVK